MAYTSNILSTTITKGITDQAWLCQLEVDGHPGLDSQDIQVRMTDHLDNEHLLFMGYIPSPTYQTLEAGNNMTIDAYSYFWFLTKQYLPPLANDFSGPQNTYLYNDTDDILTPTYDIYLLPYLYPGEYTFIDITKYVRYLLGGYLGQMGSVALTGLTTNEVVDCADWNDGSLKNKPFDFIRDDITKMDALQAIREYIGYYMLETFTDGDNPTANFIWNPEPIFPETVTFTWPSEFVEGAVKSGGGDSSSEKFNSVRVRCNPGTFTQTYTATSVIDTFVLPQYGKQDSGYESIRAGSGGAEYTTARSYYPAGYSESTTYAIGTCVLITDENGPVIYECILASLNHTPPNATYWKVATKAVVIEHLAGTSVDWVTLNNLVISPAADVVTMTYLPDVPYYEQTITVAGTTRLIEAPPIWDRDGSMGLRTQADVDEFASDYFDLCITDQSVYKATLKKRCDLRLYQKVIFIGYDKIPEVELVITRITYRENPKGVFVDIECTLDRVLTLKRAMHDYSMMSDVNLMEKIFEKKIKQTIYENTVPATLIKDEGDIAIAQTDNGIYVEKPKI